MGILLQDIKHAFRALRRSPGFTAIAVLTLGLGIGANALIFSVVNVVLLKPLPFPDPDQLCTLWERVLRSAEHKNTVSPGNFFEWETRTSSFTGMAAFFDLNFNLTGVGDPARVSSRTASANIFSVLRVEPAMGRGFRPEEGEPGADPVAIISDALWRGRLGADPGMLGRSLTLDGVPTRVVGVLPAGFEFYGEPADIWVPLTVARGPDAFQGRWLRVVARLKPGIEVARARVDLAGVAARLQEEHPVVNAGMSATVIGLRETLVGDIQRALLILLGAVGLLLLIACANVANLLLSRAAVREKEIAIRTALGASRRRVLGQLLTESLCLSVLGGTAGVLLAIWGRDLIRGLLPSSLTVPGLHGLQLDGRVLGFTLLITLVTGLLFGLAPAITTLRHHLQGALRGTGRSSQSVHRARFRDGLVVAEVSLAVVLLLAAGLLVRSFATLRGVNAGFDPRDLYQVAIALPTSKYSTDQQQGEFFDRLEQRIADLPGISATGAINFLPMSGLRSSSGFQVEGRPALKPGEEPVGDMRAVTPGYFRAMGIPIIRGRAVMPTDRAEAPAVTVISATLAHALFPDTDPVGQRIVYEWYDTVRAEIVGVAGDVHHQDLSTAPYLEIYRPAAQFPYAFMSVVIRSTNRPSTISAAVRAAVWAMDPDQPVGVLQPVRDLLDATLERPRLNTILLGLFGLVGLTLAALGIYGLMSYAVVQRTREIGIRMALGAGSGDVLRLVVQRGLRLAVIGVAIGLAAALVLTGLLSRLLYGISPRDPLTFTLVPVILASVALVASLVPALRATRVDPIIAMRAE